MTDSKLIEELTSLVMFFKRQARNCLDNSNKMQDETEVYYKIVREEAKEMAYRHAAGKLQAILKKFKTEAEEVS